MKYCLVVPDGAADRAVDRLGGRTPLEAARTPNMDRAAQEGLLGSVNFVPPRMTPGSSVAMMSVVGYDPARCFTGRGPLEAADLGVGMRPGDWAIRCNLVTTDDGTLADFTAGHISNEEAGVLIDVLNDGLGTEELTFHPGTSYRHILMYRGDDPINTETVPPHDIVGEDYREHYPQGEGAKLLIRLMENSRALLSVHEVNQVRVDLGKNPANMIWLWGQGVKPGLESFSERYGVEGAVISAVNLVRGIGRLVGWEAVHVPGATGYVDTDYAAKGRYALDALEERDMVLVHVEAPDEASHSRDVEAKVRAIEAVDRDVVGPLMAHRDLEEELRVLVVPDHVTSVEDGRHKRGPVPFAMWGAGVRATQGLPFSEAHAEASDAEIPEGWKLMGEFLEAP